MADEATTTSEEPTPEQTGGTVWDSPNQQVVRPDASGPWEEGNGGTPADPKAATDAPADLDSMTKAQLLEYAQSLGVSPANNDMTKDELRAAVDAHLAGG